MAKKLFFFGIALGLTLAVAMAVVLLNPLRKNVRTLRMEMLMETPIGMSLNEVEKTVKEMSWPTTVSLTAGFHKQERNDNSVVGVKSIRAEAGTYWAIPPIPIRTGVTYFWGFDDNGKLIDVWVWKTTDAP
jgi:hypothetical protein